MARIRTDNVFGTLTDNPLTNVATTLNSAGLANLAAVAGADRAVITLDPNRVHGAPEIVYVTAHTGAATSATILRGQEGTAARQHPSGTFWVHGWTALDAGLGTLGYVQVVVTQTGIAAEVDLAGLSAPVTVGSGRRIRVTGHAQINNDASAGLVIGRIFEGAAEVGRWVSTDLAASSTHVGDAATVLAPSAGVHTYKLKLWKFSGAGSVQVVANAAHPAYVLVEDIGAA